MDHYHGEHDASPEQLGEPLTGDDDALLNRIEDAILHIIGVDVPDMPESLRLILAAHLTGAVYTTIRSAR